MRGLSLLESFMLQLVIYILIWIVNDYVASMLLLIVPVIGAAILLLSLIFELIEPSKIPKSYYKYMLTIILAPIVVAVIYFYMNGFQLDWLE